MGFFSQFRTNIHGLALNFCPRFLSNVPLFSSIWKRPAARRPDFQGVFSSFRFFLSIKTVAHSAPLACPLFPVWFEGPCLPGFLFRPVSYPRAGRVPFDDLSFVSSVVSFLPNSSPCRAHQALVPLSFRRPSRDFHARRLVRR